MTTIRFGRIYFVVFCLIDFLFFILPSCTVQKQIPKSANSLLQVPPLATANVGISIYEPAADKYWFNYQGDHYFVPASNTKIPTCYAALKYLGDSLVAIMAAENDTAIFFLPNGDPTFLHPDFKRQPAIDYLKRTRKKLYTSDIAWQENPLGSGWAWDDYNDDYMAERNPLPVYGNLIEWFKETGDDQQPIVYSIPEVNWSINFDTAMSGNYHVTRSIN